MKPRNLYSSPAIFLLSGALLLCWDYEKVFVNSEQDSNSYIYTVNKKQRSVASLKDPMFWRDAPDILQDISKFDKLYVLYHNCAWSPMEDGSTCGAETDDAFWYMGATECFRPNAAYSLYGILSGNEDIGCQRSTFINSFFTTYGVESFTQAMSSTGLISFQGGNGGDDDNDGYPGGVSSQCSASDNADDDEGDGSSYHNKKYNVRSTSVGLGCGKHGQFAKMSFAGSFCNKNDRVSTKDVLSNFNNDLQQATCVPIYSSSNYGGDGQDAEDGALSLLSYSRSCSVREFPHACPDPYGKLHAFARSEEQFAARVANPRRERLKKIFSWLLAGLGVLLMILGILVYIRRSRLAKRKKAEWERQRNARKRNWFKKKDQNESESEKNKSRRAMLSRMFGRKQ